MPHRARVLSESGFYHVVPKGIADQTIFLSDEDRYAYLTHLAQAKRDYGLLIHAYCLMSNHVHLAVQDPKRNLSEALKYVHENYARHYAHKIGRTGGVFRKPYWSEPIEDGKRLACAVRYIHNNPFAAGICSASEYEWSSVKDYLGLRKGDLTYTSTILDMAGGVKGFVEFSRASSATAVPFEGSRLRAHLGDDEAYRLAEGILGHKPNIGATVDTAHILKSRGFSQKQIMRITGLGKNQVIKA